MDHFFVKRGRIFILLNWHGKDLLCEIFTGRLDYMGVGDVDSLTKDA